MKLIRTEGTSLVTCGPVVSKIGEPFEVDDDLGAILLAKTSITFQIVGDESPKNKRGAK